MPDTGRNLDQQIPTLNDVAKRAGVSTATVSRCLNAPDRVTDRTRDRVMAAVNALGYAPNFGARALAAKRTNTFGAIIPTMENAIFARGLQAFQEELGAHGITLLVASSSYKPDLEEEQIRTLIARGADALLLIGYDRTQQTYAFLRKRKIPYIVAWAHQKDHPTQSIGFDNRAAMQALTDEVINLGHRELALISAERRENDRARERSEGLVASMWANGLDPKELRILETPYSIANGARAFERIMATEHPPTAVLCGNDVLAAGALTKARELGIRVPQDVSITGFDDIELASIVTPPLTTVHVPHRKMGQQAAARLIAMRNGNIPEAGQELETEIKWRGSLGPAPTSSSTA
ncbi:MAG: LacI family DNA-binding transcriptional regulator [Pseudomonadota bacterium]